MNTKLENGGEQLPPPMTDRVEDSVACSVEDAQCPFEAIFEYVAMGIAYVAPNGQLLRVNQYLCDITGYTREDLLGRSLLDFAPQEDKNISDGFFREYIREEPHGKSIEKRYIRKDGSVVWMSITPTLIKKASGEPDYVIVAVQDISERKQAEEERAQMEQCAQEMKSVALALEHERLVQERTTAQTDVNALHETNRRMDEFLSIASHELKNPLAAIKGNIQLAERRLHATLRRRLPQSETEIDDTQLCKGTFEALEIADRQVSRLNRLVGDLLDISRIQVGKMEMHVALADFRAIVREVVESQRLATPERIIHLVEPEVDRVSVMVDADRIEQVIINYLANAIKYSPEDSPVEISLTMHEGEILLAVRDEGPGLPCDQHQLIWERFHQVDGAGKQLGSASGLGLGLYISKTIIEQHHGRYGVESAPGTGSIFWFSLPLHYQDA